MRLTLVHYLCGICAILAGSVLIAQLAEKHQLKDISIQVSEIKQIQAKQSTELANSVAQQTSVIHRALGQAIPIQIPDAVMQSLVTIEAQVGDQASWPKDENDARALISDLQALMRKIPPWAEDDLLPRLNVLRWNIGSIQLLQRCKAADGEDLITVSETLDEQLLAQPDGGSKNLASELINAKSGLDERIKAYRRKVVIDAAKKQIESPSPDALGVLQQLGEWANGDPEGKEASDLQRKLRAKLIADEVKKLVGTVTQTIKTADSLQDGSLRRASMLQALESVTAQQLRLLNEPDTPEDSSKALADLSEEVQKALKEQGQKQREKEDGNNRAYQLWALKNIADFKKALDQAMSRTVPGKVYGENSSPDYEGVASAMTSYLAPISSGYLDTAVGKLYSEAFDSGWRQLDDKSRKHLQTKVAEQDAVVTKKTPQDMDTQQ